MRLHPSHCFQQNLALLHRISSQRGRGRGWQQGKHLSPLLRKNTQPAKDFSHMNNHNHEMMTRPDVSSSSSSSCSMQMKNERGRNIAGTVGPNANASARITSASASTQERCIEIEEKFIIANYADLSTLEHTLKQLGFCKHNNNDDAEDDNDNNNVEFMDWYFDLPRPNWVLSTTDHWFRYRELLVSDDDCDINEGDDDKRRGVWQIKCGKVTPDNKSGRSDHKDDRQSLTVYEEFAGDEAIELAMSIIQKNALSIDEENNENNNPKNKNNDPRNDKDGVDEFMDGYKIPKLPRANTNFNCELVPFARIKTTRSSWKMQVKSDDGDNELTVDIDATDFGHMVGEVEELVNREEDVSASKERVKEITSIISGKGSNNEEDDDSPALGKLELYLIRNRKDHFDACVKSGSMKGK